MYFQKFISIYLRFKMCGTQGSNSWCETALKHTGQERVKMAGRARTPQTISQREAEGHRGAPGH